MNILLICAGGMSTSLLVEKIRKEVELKNLSDIKVDANAIENLEKIIDDYDVILVAPQIRYKEPYVKNLCKERGKPYIVIPPAVYGLVDGVKILDLAMGIKNG
ncbi:MAG: PTS sugar transporter subunit IIB [Firmicutes bacterium]|jgi:PTS system cellobiose-specific IIB component|nr:PTS sugar transporter subunit IIB [Bacillota bacterium]